MIDASPLTVPPATIIDRRRKPQRIDDHDRLKVALRKPIQDAPAVAVVEQDDASRPRLVM